MNSPNFASGHPRIHIIDENKITTIVSASHQDARVINP